MDGRDPIQESGFFRRLSDLARRSENRQGIGRWIRTRMLVGFMVAFPLVVTIFFARFIFGLMDRWFRPISERLVGEPLVGVGAVVSLLILLLLGVIATNVLGGRLLDYFEKRIRGVPLLSPIYQGARQITEAIQMHDAAEFRRVVLLPFPNQNVRSMGFVTRDFRGATAFGEEPTAMVFVPTTPNPTSGYLVVSRHRPRHQRGGGRQAHHLRRAADTDAAARGRPGKTVDRHRPRVTPFVAAAGN
jgi:uncharacterized membrane protein